MMDDNRITIPARSLKEAQYGHNDVFPGDLVSVSLGSLANEAAAHALAGLNRRLAEACLAAFRDGKDFMVGPLNEPSLADAFDPRPLHEPQRIEVAVKAGPVEPGSMDGGVPAGWTLYSVKDWQEGNTR